MKRFRFLAFIFLCSIVSAGLTPLICSADIGNEIGVQASSGDVLSLSAEDTCAAGDVISANAGTIVLVQLSSATDNGMGNTVIVEHTLTGGTKIYSLYAHLATIDSAIRKGVYVTKATKLGTMGASGFGSPCFWQNTSLGTHLHFELKKKPVTGNPEGAGQHWLYTPGPAGGFGYYDPNLYIGSIVNAYSALDKNKKIVRFGHPSRTPQVAGCLFDEECDTRGLYHTGVNYSSVSNTSFNEQFSGSTATSWNKDFGDWFLTNGFYSVKADGKSALSYVSTYNSSFSNFTYTVKMRRAGTGCDKCASRLVVRASGTVSTSGKFANTYHFQISRDGYFSVYKYRKNSEAFLVNWTASPTIKKGDAWNVLKVVAGGTNGSLLSFYINGTKVWSGTDTDSALKSGLVGFGMFSDRPAQLLIDYATLQSQ